MARQLTDDDRGKTVVNAGGARVGTVMEVRDGRGHIETDDDSSDLTDKLKSALGWDDGGDGDTRELQNDHVDRVDDDRVHLRDV